MHDGVVRTASCGSSTSPPTPLLRGEGGDKSRFALRLFNPDGSEFEKSGNGLRIFACDLWDRGLPAGPEFDILTPGGAVTAHVLDVKGGRIAMDMGACRSSAPTSASPAPSARWWMRRSWSLACACGSSASRSATRTAAFLDAQTPEVQADLGGRTVALAHRLVRPGGACPSSQPHKRPVCAGDGPAHAAHRNLGTRRRIHAGLGHHPVRPWARPSAPAAATALSPFRCPAADVRKSRRTGRRGRRGRFSLCVMAKWLRDT